MTSKEQALIKLLKLSQFPDSESFAFCDLDADALYVDAYNQAVLGLIANQIPASLQDKKWIEAQFRQKSYYIRYCHEEEKLKNCLDSYSIPFVILKGNSAAMYYSVPELRNMGDIDILVPQDLFEKTDMALSNNGYERKHNNGRHISYNKDGIVIELHHHYSHSDIDIEEYIIEGLNNRIISSIEGYDFPSLPTLPNGLVLLDHMRCHLKESLGLRQLIDWMMYVYHNLSDDYWYREFRTIVQDKGLEKLAVIATRTCQIYFGLPDTITWCKNADDRICEEFIECLLESGNFGRRNGPGNYVESVSSGIKRVGFFRWMQGRGEDNWTLYHKYKWLKPFCWIYQIIRYTIQGIKTQRSRRQLSEDFERSKKRYILLKKLGID